MASPCVEMKLVVHSSGPCKGSLIIINYQLFFTPSSHKKQSSNNYSPQIQSGDHHRAT
jgi:hypothetical protein